MIYLVFCVRTMPLIIVFILHIIEKQSEQVVIRHDQGNKVRHWMVIHQVLLFAFSWVPCHNNSTATLVMFLWRYGRWSFNVEYYFLEELPLVTSFRAFWQVFDSNCYILEARRDVAVYPPMKGTIFLNNIYCFLLLESSDEYSTQ